MRSPQRSVITETQLYRFFSVARRTVIGITLLLARDDRTKTFVQVALGH
jgi:hypothetical protein